LFSVIEELRIIVPL